MGLNNNNEVLWEKKLHIFPNNYFCDIIRLNDNSFVTTLISELKSKNIQNFHQSSVLYFNSTGNITNRFDISFEKFDFITNLSTTNDKGLLITGYSKVYNENSLLENTYGWIIKLDSLGQPSKEIKLNTSETSNINDALQSADGSVYFVGSTLSNDFQVILENKINNFEADFLSKIEHQLGKNFFLLSDYQRFLIVDDDLDLVTDESLFSKSNYIQTIDITGNGYSEIVLFYDNYISIYDYNFKLLGEFDISNPTSLYSFRNSPNIIINTKGGSTVFSFENNSIAQYKSYISFIVFIALNLLLFLSYYSFRFLYFNQEIFRLIFRSPDTGILFLNNENRIIKINPYAISILGIRNIKIEGKLLKDVSIDPLFIKKLNENKINFQFRFNDKLFSVNILKSVVEVLRKNYKLITITQKTNSEKNTPLMWMKAAEKTAHNIKTSLSSLTIGLTNLQSQIKNPDIAPDDIEDDIKLLSSEVIHIKKLSSNFLKVMQLENPNFKKNSIIEVIEKIKDKYSGYFGNGIKLEFNYEDNNSFLFDEYLIEIAISNIITNAIEAMNNSGILNIELIKTKSFVDSDEAVRIDIIDNGPGIKTENLNKIFEPFFTTKASGNGIGLSISKKIIEDHLGKIEAQSKPGLGTTFTIILPIKYE